MPFLATALVLSQAAGIDWKKDYDAALREAAKGGRYVVVYFAGPDCPPCARMAETTFKDKAVGEIAEVQAPRGKIRYKITSIKYG